MLTKLAENLVIADPIEGPSGSLVAPIAAPWVVFRTSDHVGPHRIEMEVAADLKKVASLFDEVPFKTSLKQVPYAGMAAVKVARVTAIEVLHSRRQVRFGSLDE